MPFDPFRLDPPDFGLRNVEPRHGEPETLPRQLRQCGTILFDSAGQPFDIAETQRHDGAKLRQTSMVV